MFAFIVRRLLIAIPVMFIVVSLTFLLVRLMPGSPFDLERSQDKEAVRRMEVRYELDGPLWWQYARYIGAVARGDLRESISQYRDMPVTEILKQTLPVSLLLGSIAYALSVSVGVLLGAVAAVHHNQWQDRAAMFLAIGGISLPVFLLAPLLILLSLITNLLPPAGWGDFDQLILPSICLAVPYAASVARLTRASFLEVLGHDYVRTARAKGLSENVVVYKHALKVAILPVISYCGPLAASILTGSLVVETIFKIPGMGPFFVNSVLSLDVFMVGGTVIVFAALLILFNIVVDVLYFVIDRRIKLD
ncbi:MAG: ABC transporter permease [Candidatus Methylacidiphilales bacterium]|nr:ABC transporter permease [Candidatus Methylacidiphilales bacterium]